MKAALFIFGILISFNSFAENEEWIIRTTDTSCSIHTSEFFEVNDQLSIHLYLAFAVVSKSHDLPKPLTEIGLKPNEFTIQMKVSTHNLNSSSNSEIKEDIQVTLKKNELKTFVTDYGTTYYLSGNAVKNVLEEMANDKPMNLYMKSKSLGKLTPITPTNKRFMINYHLLKSCAAYFV